MTVLPIFDHEMEWAAQAACRGASPDLFMTPGDDLDDEPYYPSVEAKALCDVCPVRVDCLAWALLRKPYGIWGGLTLYQRRQIDRVKERASCPACGAKELVIAQTVELCLACGVSWYVL